MIGIFFITTHWGRKFGGINSVNYSLLKGIEKIVSIDESLNWKLYCILTDSKLDSDEIYEIKEKDGIIPINLKKPEESKQLENIIKDLNFQQVFFIGHDVFTGSSALKLKAKYKNSTSVIIHHMSYRHYYFLRNPNPKKYEEKDRLQKKVIPQADIVITIGPKLKKSADDILIDSQNGKKAYEIIPGLEDIEPIKQPHNTHTIILFGRMEKENNELKQIPLALHAIGRYTKQLDSDSKPQVKCFGYSEDSVENQQQLLNEVFKEAEAIIPGIANKYIEDEYTLFNEIRNASLCIMPSYYEGFGLAAYEAIAAGVPVIITKNTGLYQLLANKKGDPVDGYIKSFELKGNPNTSQNPYTESDIANLTDCIKDIFSNYENSKKSALHLRDLLLEEHYTWEYTAISFINILKDQIQIKHHVSLPENPSQNTKKAIIGTKEYFLDFLISDYCKNIFDPKKTLCKIIKYSNSGDRRFTLLSSDENKAHIYSELKARKINEGTVGIMNSQFNRNIEFPIILSNFTNGKCYLITNQESTELQDSVIGVPDHHVLSILAVPLIHDSNLVGALTFDIFDDQFIDTISNDDPTFFNLIYNNMYLFSKILIEHFYYQIIDDLRFSEVKKTLKIRQLVSFSGKCELNCNHCFAQDLIIQENENTVNDVVQSLSDKSFDVVYISYRKENFFNPVKGVNLCKEIYENYKCDICVTTRCVLTGAPLKEIIDLNDIMRSSGNHLTFCISIPAFDSYKKMECSDFIPSPQERIDFAKKLKNAGINSFVTIRPLFPQSVIPTSEIQKIVDHCVNNVDAILTGGLCVTDTILGRLALSENDLNFLDDEASEYLNGVESESNVRFRHVDVNSEIEALDEYCQNKDIPFFKHSMDALNYFKETL